MTSRRVFCLLATACLVAGPAARVRGGVTDTPLPTFSNQGGGGAAKLVAILPTVVKNHNLQTDVLCTNVGATPVDVGLEVFDQAGLRGNTIAAGNGAMLNLPAGGPVTIGTGATVGLHEDVTIVLEAPVTRLAQGTARVVATSLQVACVAYAVDRLHAIKDPRHSAEQPPTIAVLPVRSACSPAACADGDPCTIDGCDHAGVCTHTVVPNGTACEDGNACTTADVCEAGRCGGTPVGCDDGNACTTDTCDTTSGCLHTAIPNCPTTTTVSTTTTSTSTSSTTTSIPVPPTTTTSTSTSTSSTTSSSSSTSTSTSSTSTTSTPGSSAPSSTTSTSSTSSTTSSTNTTSSSTTSTSTTSSTVVLPTTTSSTLASPTTTSTVATTTSTTSVTSTTTPSSSTTTTLSTTTTTLGQPPVTTTSTVATTTSTNATSSTTTSSSTTKTPDHQQATTTT